MPSGNQTKMIYPEAEKMVEILHTGAEQLQDIMDAVKQCAERVDNGALLGEAGDALSTSLRSTFTSAIDKLASKVKDQSDYVQTEIYDMRQAERKASDLFNN